MNAKKSVKNIRWLGHAGFLINEKPSTYINPYDLAFPDIGDLILITDADPHHCAPDTIKWLRKGSTIIIAPENCVGLFTGAAVLSAKPGSTLDAKGAKVDVLPAEEGDGSNQTGSMSGVAYVITYPNGFRICHLGKAATVPQEAVREINALLMPLGGREATNVQKAAELANQINSGAIIPMQWDDDPLDPEALAQFQNLCTSDVVVLKRKR